MSAPPDPESAPAGLADTQTIACDVAMRWLWDYVDARLPGAPRVALEAHLATCAACPTHVAFARAVRRALADAPAPMPADAADAGRTAALRARVQRALAEAQADVTSHADHAHADYAHADHAHAEPGRG